MTKSTETKIAMLGALGMEEKEFDTLRAYADGKAVSEADRLNVADISLSLAIRMAEAVKGMVDEGEIALTDSPYAATHLVVFATVLDALARATLDILAADGTQPKTLADTRDALKARRDELKTEATVLQFTRMPTHKGES